MNPLLKIDKPDGYPVGSYAIRVNLPGEFSRFNGDICQIVNSARRMKCFNRVTGEYESYYVQKIRDPNGDGMGFTTLHNLRPLTLGERQEFEIGDANATQT